MGNLNMLKERKKKQACLTEGSYAGCLLVLAYVLITLSIVRCNSQLLLSSNCSH